MRILYLSVHAILEFDEIKLLLELGQEVFSHGAYTGKNPNGPGIISGDPKRPAITEATYYPRLYDLALTHSKENLPQEMIDWADTIICMHRASWIAQNLDKIGEKRVIWRSIGQADPRLELLLRQLKEKCNLKLVRYSPAERGIPNYAGEDAVVRFYKDPEEFKGWAGEVPQVITIGQMVKPREPFCRWALFEQVSRGFPRMLIGPQNEAVTEMRAEELSYGELKTTLKESRVFFYTGTYPAPYTLSLIEAMVSGIPVVAAGAELRNAPFGGGKQLYEIPEIITNGVNGYVSNNVGSLRMRIRSLLKDHRAAAAIGARGRERAIELFGKEEAKKRWREILEG